MFAELASKRSTMDPARFAELLGLQREVNPLGDVGPENMKAENEGYGFNFSPYAPEINAANPMGVTMENGMEPRADFDPAAWMDERGYKLMQGPAGNKTWARYLLDSAGQQVGGAQTYDLRGEEAGSYRNMLAIMAAGAAAGGAFDGLGAAGNAAEAADFGSMGLNVADGLAGAGGAGGLGGTAASITPEMMATMSGEQLGAMLGGGEVAGGSLGSMLGGLGGGFSPGSAALSLGSALINQYGAGKVADAQQRGADQANATALQMYQQQRQDMAPYRDAGSSALSQIQALLKDPNSITQQPGYQFGLNEGTKALGAGAAARGMTYSGAQGKALQRYGQDYAGTKLNESYNRLSNLAGLGQVGATGSAGAAGQYGQTVGNNQTGMGNARGSAFASTANGWTNALGQIGNSMQENQLLNLLKQQKVGP